VSNTPALLDALRAVPGVSAADIESDDRPEGAGTLRLQLEPGADEVAVATSVNRVLREQFGLAVDANRVQVVEEAEPLRTASPDPLTSPIDDVLDAGPAASEPAPPRPTLTAVPGFLGQAEPEDSADEARWQSVGFDEGLGAVRPEPSTAQVSLGTAVGTEGPSERISSVDVAAESLPARSARILIARMQLVSAGLGVTSEVTLAWQGTTFAGQAVAAATPTSVHRAVAQATLRAVEGAIGGRARFELEQLEINQLGPDRAVVVVVSMLTKAGSERLTGVSVVREDVRQAVIRATLDALNRRLESLLQSA